MSARTPGRSKLIWLYHITHIDNLASIVSAGGLWSDAERRQRGFGHASIAHEHIKHERLQRPVDKAARGVLADYVPFYLAPRSPMLFAIHKGGVKGYEGGQEPIVHLAASVDALAQAGHLCCFSDRHAKLALAKFHDDLSLLRSVIRWDVMGLKFYWGDPETPEAEELRQAEFLVHQFCPWMAFPAIGVHNEAIKEQVEAILVGASHRPVVRVARDWYYKDKRDETR
jgi:hypothetical protein